MDVLSWLKRADPSARDSAPGSTTSGLSWLGSLPSALTIEVAASSSIGVAISGVNAVSAAMARFAPPPARPTLCPYLTPRTHTHSRTAQRSTVETTRRLGPHLSSAHARIV
eukprot:6193603-Pleurochrysis_carterae.AAC.3